MKAKNITKQHLKCLCFEYGRIGNITLLTVFNKVVFQKVGNLYVLFNKFGMCTTNKNFKLYRR